MSIKEKILNRIGLTTIKKEPIQKNKAQNYSGGYGQYKATPIINMPFGGEKNWGEMGAAKNYKPVYTLLALRSWEMWLSSDIASSILRNYTLWSIGQGLRLQAHPETTVLSTEGIDLTKEQIKSFVNQTDARFKIHTNSRYSSFSRNDTLHTLAEEAQKNAKIAGDCLVILRYDQSTGLNADIVDGMSVETPPLTNAFHASAKDKNNKIVHGVEINARKTPIAYYVKQDDLSYIRIPARSRALNKTTAFLVYGNRYRVDYVRGLPLFSCVIETLMKLDIYKEAEVGSTRCRFYW